MKSAIAEEVSHLERIAGDSWYAVGANPATIRYSHEVFVRHFRDGSALELGPAEGVMTEYLAARFADLTLVDGADTFCRELLRRYPKARVVHSLFEHYNPDRKFDNIVLGHVLEHVADPVEILSLAKPWLTPNGRILAAVPNARSLHRQAAVLMGLLETEESMNEADRHHGHRRVFNPETFRNAFLKAGLRIEIFGGYWLKPVSNRQIEENWSTDMLRAFMILGERYPDIAGEIYVVASLAQS
jgi:2-polyprenyl-3-methyl-5-hydroxy-6-metoxy-1,4-benzoquinol methylase